MLRCAPNILIVILQLKVAAPSRPLTLTGIAGGTCVPFLRARPQSCLVGDSLARV